MVSDVVIEPRSLRQLRSPLLFVCVNSGVLLLFASLATFQCGNAFQYVNPDGARWEIARKVGNGLKEPKTLSSRANRVNLALRMSTQAGKTLSIQSLLP
jgi:hypothetical protein